MQFPVNSLQGTGESPNRRGAVTTCTTGICAASGEEVDRKLRPTLTLASPPSPRVAGRPPLSGPICNRHAIFAGSASFAAVSLAPDTGREKVSLLLDDREITPIGTLLFQTPDIRKVPCWAIEVRPLGKIAALCCRIQNQRGLDLRWRCSIGSVAKTTPRRRRTFVKILRFGATRRKSSLVPSNLVIMHVSVPGGAWRDESLKRSSTKTAASREVPVSSRLGSSLSWPTEFSCAR
jgi:hypothetical protein